MNGFGQDILVASVIGAKAIVKKPRGANSKLSLMSRQSINAFIDI